MVAVHTYPGKVSFISSQVFIKYQQISGIEMANVFVFNIKDLSLAVPDADVISTDAESIFGAYWLIHEDKLPRSRNS